MKLKTIYLELIDYLTSLTVVILAPSYLPLTNSLAFIESVVVINSL